jgi:hypothetical protein
MAGMRQEAQRIAAIRREVRKRDHRRCRNCWSAKDVEFHSLRFRRQRVQYSTRLWLLLCALCKADIHAYRLAIEGKDANGFLVFRWTYQG